MIAKALALLALMTTPASLLTEHEVLRVSEGDSPASPILVIHCIAPNLQKYSPAEKADWDRILGDSRKAWADADHKGRAQIVLGMLKAMPFSRSVAYYEAHFLLDGEHLVRCRKLLVGDGSLSAWSCKDVETGFYWAVRILGPAVDIDDLLARLRADDPERIAERLAVSLRKGRSVAYVEVAGRQAIVPSSSPDPTDIGAELAAIWDEIADPSARQRLGRVAQLFEQLAEEMLQVPGKPAGWPKVRSVAATFALPLSVATIQGIKSSPRPKIEMVFSSGLGPSLELPDRELTRPWLGEAGWREPDLSGSASILLRRFQP